MKYRILIVDDDFQIRKFIRKICGKIDCVPDEAEDGNSALELIKNNEYDLCIFDMIMPGFNGLELADQAFRKKEHPSVLILTGHPDVNMAVNAIKRGVYDYIQKPIEPEQLQIKIMRALRYREGCLRSMEARKNRELNVQDIQAQNQHFRSMLELCYDAILLADCEKGQILDCNTTACECLDYSREKLLQMEVFNLLKSHNFDEWSMFADFIYDEHNMVFTGDLVKADGSLIPAEFSASMAYSMSNRSIAIVARDITERKTSEMALEKERINTSAKASKLHSMLENLSNAVAFLDSKKRISEVNEAFLNLVRMPRELVAGASYSSIFNEQAEVIESMYQTFESGGLPTSVSLTVNFCFAKKSINFQPVQDNGEFHGIMITIVDVSEYLEACDDAEKSKNTQKDVFLKLMSDIKTEMESIDNVINLALDNENADVGQKALLKSVRDCATTVNCLIADAQESVEIENRKLGGDISNFDLRKLIRSAIRHSYNDATRIENDINLDIDEAVPEKISGYADHLKETISNLINDASNRLDADTLILKVCTAKNEEETTITFYVSDILEMNINSTGTQEYQGEMNSFYPGTDSHVWYLKGLAAMNDGYLWSIQIDNQLKGLCLRIHIK